MNKQIGLYQYWDIGEEEIIVPTINRLGAILNALILCKGKMIGSNSRDIGDFEWKYPPRHCGIAMRIVLLIGSESKFEKLSEVTLFDLPEAHI